jgi:D-beta-D-heptose 7-phosphate kinase/D-beta-D-heptose 1-phosphate adenosyltransferase
VKAKFKHFFDNKKRPKVLVVGDLILDEYIWGSVNRISPEAPVPVLESKSENLALGGAANVANNLVALGCEVYLVGGIGKDEKGDKLLDLIKNRSIHAEGVYRFAHRPTTSKVRVIANNQQVLRIDKEDNRPITEETENKFIKYLNDIIPQMDGVICSDYHKGILSEKITNAVMQRARKSKKQVVVDPKGTDFHKYNGATVITPNQHEVERVAPIKINSREDLDRAAEYLLTLTKSEGILITRGKDGMIFYHKKDKAGDTVISVFGMSLFSGFSYEEAAWLANMSAGIVVGKIGTAVVTLDEINEFLKEEMLRTSSAVLELNEVKQVVSLAKSVGKSIVFTNGCFLFRFDSRRAHRVFTAG